MAAFKTDSSIYVSILNNCQHSNRNAMGQEQELTILGTESGAAIVLELFSLGWGRGDYTFGSERGKLIFVNPHKCNVRYI